MLLLALTCAAAFHELHAERATASSFLVSNWNQYTENYHPSYVLDGDKKTAWVEGKDGDGVGESLSVDLSPLKSARTLRLAIDNGYQKSKDLLGANGAPKTVTVVVVGPDGAESGRKTATLSKKMGAQNIEVPLTHGLKTVTVTIDEVTPGRVYKDTCITDVHFFVDSDVQWNGTAEKAKHASLLRWVKERKADAAFFAAKPAEWPFTSTRFVAGTATTKAKLPALRQPGDDPQMRVAIDGTRTVKEQLTTPLLAAADEGDRGLIARLVALDDATAGVARGLAAAADAADVAGTAASQKMLDAHPDDPWNWQQPASVAYEDAFDAVMNAAAKEAPAAPVAGGVWRSSPEKKALPQPDGLEPWVPVNRLRFNAITFFEAQSALASTKESVETEVDSGETYTRLLGHSDRSNFLVIDDAGGGHAVYSKVRTTSEIRGVSTTLIRTLSVYDAAGHLVAQAVAQIDNEVNLAWQAHEFVSVNHFVWDGDKVSAVRRVSTHRDEETLVLEEQTWSAKAGS